MRMRTYVTSPHIILHNKYNTQGPHETYSLGSYRGEEEKKTCLFKCLIVCSSNLACTTETNKMLKPGLFVIWRRSRGMSIPGIPFLRMPTPSHSAPPNKKINSQLNFSDLFVILYVRSVTGHTHSTHHSHLLCRQFLLRVISNLNVLTHIPV